MRQLRNEAGRVAEAGAEAAGYADGTEQIVNALTGAADLFEEAIVEYKRGNTRKALDALQAANMAYDDLGGESVVIEAALERALKDLQAL